MYSLEGVWAWQTSGVQHRSALDSAAGLSSAPLEEEAEEGKSNLVSGQISGTF